jgi:DNA-binding transcriptional ArsR family regulator
MQTDAAVERLSALAHDSRLEIFRRLIQRGPEGMPAGQIAEQLAIAAPTLSFHLAHLTRAGLVVSRRAGRSITYSAVYPAIEELIAYLYENCCGHGACAPAGRQPSAPGRKARRAG